MAAILSRPQCVNHICERNVENRSDIELTKDTPAQAFLCELWNVDCEYKEKLDYIITIMHVQRFMAEVSCLPVYGYHHVMLS